MAGGERSAMPVVSRGRRARSEAEVDREVLRWIGRFRFVTAAELSLRFGASEQRINARVRRFIDAGLVAVSRDHVSQARALYLTARGAQAVGQPRRKPPRAETQRRHELAVARLVAEHELAGHRVMTERECRQAERNDPGRRWSIDLSGGEKRWPDLVVDLGDRRRAVELELAIKHTARLRDIVDGYQQATTFDAVLWLVEHPTHLVRIRRLIDDATGSDELRAVLGLPRGTQTAEPWAGV